jgi:hypothetical protein
MPVQGHASGVPYGLPNVCGMPSTQNEIKQNVRG